MINLPPLSYNLRSLFVRWSSTLLTVVGIGATVAVLAGILALEQGFSRLYTQSGRDNVVMFLRPGATSEGESSFPKTRAALIKKEVPEIAKDEAGQPLASGEVYLAVRRKKVDGGETNVPIRGVEQMSFKIAGESFRMAEGKNFKAGFDEVIIGRDLTKRIQNCQVGDVIQLNTTPFRVVGIFEYDGPFQSEIWGDANRIGEALQRKNFNRILAKVKAKTDVAALDSRLESDKRVPAKVMTESAYLKSQTQALSTSLYFLGTLLGLIMGVAAVFTGANTMLAAISARSHEIGVLISIGFRPFPVFLSFVFEALILGLLGGIVGCLLVLPLHGVNTGTTNFQTFTEVAFAFQVTPKVLVSAVVFAMMLGFLGGLVPAAMAAYQDPVEALRRK